MSHLQRLSAFGGLLMLTGCFVSESPLIPPGQAVLPVDGPITVCLEEADPCFEMQVSGDGYETAPQANGELGRARFSPLTQAADRQVYILEAQTEGGGLTYILARRAPNSEPRGASFELAGIACSDLPDTVLDRFESDGGIYSGGFVANCASPNLDVLKVALVNGFSTHLDDPNWWLEQGS